jgi:hypothetical protein
MRERLLTLGCALGALVLFVTMFLNGRQVAGRRAALPTTVERGGNGLSGALTWLGGEGVRALSLRERFDVLRKRRDLPAAGNLLVVSLPVTTPFSGPELRALDDWLRAGNTLLVLAAIADKPDWARGGVFWTDLEDLTGLTYEPVRVRGAAGAAPAPKGEDVVAMISAASRPFATPERTTLIPDRPHPYLDGVAQATAWSDYPWRVFPWQVWAVKVPRDGFVLSLARQRETGEGVLWTRPNAAGTVIVSGFASLFSNRALGLPGNARLLANIVAASLGPRGAVLFDDEHQGLSVAYDAAQFYRDPRLYRTLGVLLLMWLVWVLGGTRLRLPQPRTSAPREAQLVRATGTFLARVLKPAAAARRMFGHFERRLLAAHYGTRMPAGALWELLEQQPRIARADLERLRDWYARAYAGERVPLRRLHNLIVRIERQLAA